MSDMMKLAEEFPFRQKSNRLFSNSDKNPNNFKSVYQLPSDLEECIIAIDFLLNFC